MKRKWILVGLLVAVGAYVVVRSVGFPEMRYTVHVIGEDGQPIEGVNTIVTFNLAPFGFGIKSMSSKTTDSNGNFTAAGYSEDGVPTFQKALKKDGYYWSGIPMSNFYKSSLGHWQPWDQTYTTVMRKVGKPIPMYAKNAYSEIPAVDQPCGYDFEVGDWVVPYGNGKVADFILTLKRQHKDDDDYDDSVVLTFSNPNDGIQEVQLPKEFSSSLFKWPREAPEDGYQPNFLLHHWCDSASGMHGDIGDAFTNKKYIFRVRTQKDGDKIVSALYGRINQGLQLAPNSPKTCGISIYYYLNPTPLDRDLEYSGESLFKNLPNDQHPNAP